MAIRSFTSVKMASALSFAIAFICVLSPIAKAYETDTHLYMTYAMARYAGLNHEVSSVIASAAQWPDETELLGSPMLAELGLGTKMRRLFHFPCPAVSDPRAAHSGSHLVKEEGKLFVPMTLNELQNNFSIKNAAVYIWHKFVPPTVGDAKYVAELNTVCSTQERHRAAYRMLLEGLFESNLIKAATSIHTIEDSFAHAGTPSNLGHAFQGHIPDRCINSDKKCRDMISAVMAAIFAIRAQLPPSAIDKDFSTMAHPEGKKNWEFNIEELHHGFISDPRAQQLWTTDMYQDPRMIRRIIKFYFDKAKQPFTAGGITWQPWIFGVNVEKWIDTQTDIVAEINKGPKGKCVLDKANITDPKNSVAYTNCLIASLVTRLAVDPKTRDGVLWSRPQTQMLNYVKNASEPIGMGVVATKKLQQKMIEIRAQFGQARPTKLNNSQLEELIFNRALVDLHMQLNGLFSGRSFLQETHDFVESFMAGYVPRKQLGDYNRYEFENEGELRMYELNMRIRNVRSTIYKLTGDYVRFIENDKTWSYPETRFAVQNLPLRQEEILPLKGEVVRTLSPDEKPNVLYIGFNYRQIDIWVEMAIRFMFPDFLEQYFPAGQCSMVSRISKGKNASGVEQWLNPVFSVKNADDIYIAFAAALLAKNEKKCAKVDNGQLKSELFVFSGLTSYAASSVIALNPGGALPLAAKLYLDSIPLQKRTRTFLNDFESTHLRPPFLAASFESTEAYENYMPQELKDRKTPKFSNWGQLTIDEEFEIFRAHTARLAQKYEVEKSGRTYVDTAPYSTKASTVDRHGSGH